jgi:predicted permease
MPDWKELVRAKLAPLALPAAREAEIVEELALLLEDYYREARSRGDSEDEAAGFARSQVPSWEALAGGIREADGPASRLGGHLTKGGTGSGLMGGILHDVRFGLRVLAKRPGFTSLAALILALGIGLNASVFSVVNAMLFKPLPVAAPEELVRVYSSTPTGFMDHEPMAFPDFRDIRDRTRTLEPLAAYSLSPLALESGEESEFVIGELVTGDYFATLGLGATLGRTLEAEDDREGMPRPVTVLSHSTWRSRFGGDPAILGRELHLNGHQLTVVGVGPAGFSGLSRGVSAELWIPMALTRRLRAAATVSADEPSEGLDKLEDRGRRWLWVMGRRRPGVAFEQAEAELRLLGEQLRQEYPETNRRRSIVTLAAKDVRLLPGLDGALAASSAVLMGFVALVLLIACANIANMLLARATSRSQEMGVRLSLGASRGRLIQQLMTESLLLSLLGGGLGLVLALWSNRWLNGIELGLPVQLALGLSIDWRVLLFSAAVCLATALGFGLVPALRATRGDLSEVLKEESRATGSPGKRLARGGLVVAQVSLSLLLLICAGLSLRSTYNAHRIDPGFDSSGVVVASLYPQLQGYTPAEAADFFRRLLDQVRELPGVESAGVVSHLLLSFEVHTEKVTPNEGEPLAPEEWPDTSR